MKRLITGLMTVFLLALTSNIATAQQQEADDSPEILGVLMYADWCSKCEVLDPKLQKIEPEFENKGILFTRFDMTDDFTTEQSAMLARLLGLNDLFKEHEGRTGYMVLLDAETHEVLKTLKHDKSEEELKGEIESVL